MLQNLVPLNNQHIIIITQNFVCPQVEHDSVGQDFYFFGGVLQVCSGLRWTGLKVQDIFAYMPHALGRMVVMLGSPKSLYVPLTLSTWSPQLGKQHCTQDLMSEYALKVEMEATSLTMTGPRHWCSVTLNCLLLTKVVIDLHRFKRKEQRPHLSMEGVSKNLTPTLICYTIL
jgi:hypothetical protein